LISATSLNPESGGKTPKKMICVILFYSFHHLYTETGLCYNSITDILPWQKIPRLATTSPQDLIELNDYAQTRQNSKPRLRISRNITVMHVIEIVQLDIKEQGINHLKPQLKHPHDEIPEFFTGTGIHIH